MSNEVEVKAIESKDNNLVDEAAVPVEQLNEKPKIFSPMNILYIMFDMTVGLGRIIGITSMIILTFVFIGIIIFQLLLFVGIGIGGITFLQFSDAPPPFLTDFFAK